ncbi:hypothetical protein ACQKGA_29300 [Priestia megaterium]|uniref:hypothetical protein n=1 Tax=Priestia TaxID=2800373 RepID=UPI000BA57098|nr:hypothetical protein [Priestia megaterium]PAK42959.1 hypothetical protein CHH47_28305 [Priestia megaterium]
MNLPKGVTGFYSSIDNKPNEIDENHFKNICFNLVRKNQGRILEIDEPNLATNFSKIKVDIFNREIYVLLNAYYPFLALASTVEFQHLNFIDDSVLSKDFIPFYKVLSKEELNEPLDISKSKGKVSLENKNTLNSSELEQILYWQPKTVGEVIFNFWD